MVDSRDCTFARWSKRKVMLLIYVNGINTVPGTAIRFWILISREIATHMME
jgi:hypothetical protein